jgi:hypothetical protein
MIIMIIHFPNKHFKLGCQHCAMCNASINIARRMVRTQQLNIQDIIHVPPRALLAYYIHTSVLEEQKLIQNLYLNAV